MGDMNYRAVLSHPYLDADSSSYAPMSTRNRTCNYVFNPADPKSWGGEEGDKSHIDESLLGKDGLWRCPHDAEENEDECIFHLPLDKKDDGAVITEFLDILSKASDSDRTTNERALEFVNARFGMFDLSGRSLDIVLENEKIVLSHALVDGVLDWSDSTFDLSQIELQGIKCLDDALFVNTEFICDAKFIDATFSGEIINFSKTIFELVNFRGSEFKANARFGGCEFREGATFTSAIFEKRVRFSHATFEKPAWFESTVFNGYTEFTYTTFGENDGFKIDNVDNMFVGVEFNDMVSFEWAVFQGNVRFLGTDLQSIAFCHAEFQAIANFHSAVFKLGDFTDATFMGKAIFTDTVFEKAGFADARFGGDADFSGSKLEDASFDDADITGVTFMGTDLQGASFESALLSRAILTGADLRGAKLAGAVLGDIRINEETQFLGHASDDGDISLGPFSSLRSKQLCVYDPKYGDANEHEDLEKAKSVYRALEVVASKAALPRLQSRCFVRRQDLQKDDYKQDTKTAGSLPEFLIAGARYSQAKVARATLLYGESPWRIIAGSIGSILVFALMYPLGGWVRPVDGDPITYTRIWGDPTLLGETLYYSTLTFTTLGLGDYRPVGAGQYLTTMNTALGAVLIALLVFVLGRRAAR